MNKHLLSVLAGLAILLAAGGVYLLRNISEIHPGVYCFGLPRDGGLRPLFRGDLPAILDAKLNLTESQLLRVRELDESTREATEHNKSRFPVFMKALKNEMFKNAMDKRKINAILEEMDALKRGERAMFLESVFAVREMLTRNSGPFSTRTWRRVSKISYPESARGSVTPMTAVEFEQFVEETRGIVLSAVRRYLPPELFHAIDDVAQETYLRAYRGMGRSDFPDRGSLNNWLYTIARNESLRMAEKFYREHEGIKLLAEELLSRADDSPLDMGDEIRLIRETISALPEKYREVFELLVMGFSENQIAGKLSLRHGTIKSRLHRGRELLARMLSERRAI